MNSIISKGRYLKDMNVSPFKPALKHNKVVTEM